MGKAPKYVSAAYLSECTSLTARYFTGRACEGKIPGAVQPSGPGGAWRFDEAQFWAWWKRRERQAWQPSIKEARSGGGVSSVRAVTSGNRLEQLLGLLPRDD